MKTTTNSRLKANQTSAKPAPQQQQVSTVKDEADYYNTIAEMALLKSDYFHMQYNY
ncbi:MAG: hypothetical protein ACR2LR_01420 [Hassallia sp.]